MASMSVGSEDAVQIDVAGRQRLMIQNLGPGDLYLDETPEVTTETGVKIPPNCGYEASTPAANDDGFWVISSGTSDVRFLRMDG